ncbi:hypothetical protein RCL1_004557 [Eukaryota sp. TZLM3-RCL]
MNNRIFDTLVHLLSSKNLRFHSDDHTLEILSSVTSPSGAFLLRFKCLDLDNIILYAEILTPCPSSQIPLMVEFLNRINFGLPVGGFELNILNGLIRYRVDADFYNIDDIEGLLITLLTRNVKTVERYLPSIVKLCEGTSLKKVMESVSPIELETIPSPQRRTCSLM